MWYWVYGGATVSLPDGQAGKPLLKDKD